MKKMIDEIEEHSSREFGLKVSESLPPLNDWIGKIRAIGAEEYLPKSGLRSVILFLDDDRLQLVRVTSEMNDYDERGEAGRLCFDRCKSVEIDRESLVFYKEIPRPISVKKLKFICGDFSTESGLAFSFEDLDDVVIVAAAFPYYISVIGVSEEYSSAAEFPLSEYNTEYLNLSN